MNSVPVTVANFNRAESDRMFSDFARIAGGLNRFFHYRVPTPLDQQTVIRMNRDTLYSGVVTDLEGEPQLTIPEAGDRYLSAMVVNQDHYVNRVFRAPGSYTLRRTDFDTQYVSVAVRILVDSNDPADVAAVNALQDEFRLTGTGTGAFPMPDYDRTSLDAVRAVLLELGKWAPESAVRFGRKDEVDPVGHLIATAAGWGGLPPQEAAYGFVAPRLPVGHYVIEVPAEVPVDAFWSVSVYNEDGFFEPNDRNSYNVNSVTASRNDDGSVYVNLGGCDEDLPNCIPLTEGWNYVVRMYRPRPEVLDGSWTFPVAQPA